MNKFFVVETQNLLKKHTRYINGNPSWPKIKELTELTFLLIEIEEKSNLSAQNQVLIKRLINILASEVYVLEKIFYYHSLYKLPQAYYSCDSETIGKATYKANIDISVMRLKMMLKLLSGCSEDDYYFSRGEYGLLRATTNLLKHNTNVFNLVPTLYTLTNYLQSINEYIRSGEQYYKEQALKIGKDYLDKILSFIEIKEFSNIFNSNLQLKLFVLSTKKNFLKLTGEESKFEHEEIVGFSEYNNITKKLWAYLNLREYDSNLFLQNFLGDFESLFEPMYTKLNAIDQIVLLRACLNYLWEKGEVDLLSLEIPVVEEFEKNDWFKMENFFSKYNELSTVVISEADRKKVIELDDNLLREKVSNVIINIDSEVVEREKKKPHGVYEISDMELPIRYKGSTFHLCMPFKSGKEIAGKVKEEVSYQVYRPFANFGSKAIVVFVSPREATEPFHNALKRASSNLNWTIYTLLDETLIKLLKVNGEI